jgi:hypothetical protein
MIANGLFRSLAAVNERMGRQRRGKLLRGASIDGGECRLGVNLDRVSRFSQPFNFRFAPKATVGDRSAARREWDGPAALPPPTALRVRGGLPG